MKQSKLIEIALSGIILSAIAIIMMGTASAKSLYVIADINTEPTPIQTYEIKDGPIYLEFQAETDVPDLGWGAVGLAIDEASKKLFITYEGSSSIQLIDATNFNDLGTTTAPGASNLAGIVVDHGKSKVYTVDRNTHNLYVYSWDSANNVLTLDGDEPVELEGTASAYGLALDEIQGLLFVGDNTTTVHVYNTSDLAVSPVAETMSVDLSAEGQAVIGIAVDSQRNLLYTGNARSGSVGKLVKYDLNNNAISAHQLSDSGDHIVGVAVDEDTGNVYVTTGNQYGGGTDTLLVFDSDLTVLKDDIGDIGNPTGLAVPREDISYVELDNYKCYVAETAEDTPAFEKRWVVLEDQFGLSEAQVIREQFLCNPVSMDGSEIQQQDTHLVCYQIIERTTPVHPDERLQVDTSDQFGELTLDVKNARLLCIPASKGLLTEIDDEEEEVHIPAENRNRFQIKQDSQSGQNWTGIPAQNGK